jgi:hypothetical protein
MRPRPKHGSRNKGTLTAASGKTEQRQGKRNASKAPGKGAARTRTPTATGGVSSRQQQRSNQQAKPQGHRHGGKTEGQGMTADARKAIDNALDALSSFRADFTSLYERHSEEIFDRMSDAAKAMGWAPDVIDATRQQMHQAAQVQLQMIEQLSRSWEQVKPGDATKGMLLPSEPSLGGVAGMQTTPFQLWMDATQMWQRNWQQAFSSFMGSASDRIK